MLLSLNHIVSPKKNVFTSPVLFPHRSIHLSGLQLFMYSLHKYVLTACLQEGSSALVPWSFACIRRGHTGRGSNYSWVWAWCLVILVEHKSTCSLQICAPMPSPLTFLSPLRGYHGIISHHLLGSWTVCFTLLRTERQNKKPINNSLQ